MSIIQICYLQGSKEKNFRRKKRNEDVGSQLKGEKRLSKLFSRPLFQPRPKYCNDESRNKVGKNSEGLAGKNLWKKNNPSQIFQIWSIKKYLITLN